MSSARAKTWKPGPRMGETTGALNDPFEKRAVVVIL